MSIYKENIIDTEYIKNNTTIEPLELVDLEDYRTLLIETIKTVETMESYKKDFESNVFSHYFKLIYDEQFIGALSIWHVFDDIQIINLSVAHNKQGMGFGTRLMKFLLSYANKHLVKRITLEVRMSNEIAIALYENHNFKKEAVRKNYYKDGEDAYLMVNYV